MQDSLPESLSKLLGNISTDQQNYVLEARKQILGFDDHIIEVGRTTSTEYGLRKGEKQIYKTLVCAKFIPFHRGVYRPKLLLLLPYPKREWAGQGSGRTYKREKVKGLTWVEASHTKAWDQNSQLKLYFYTGKSQSRYSSVMDLTPYESMCHLLLGKEDLKFTSLFDIINLALNEWKLQVDERDQ